MDLRLRRAETRDLERIIALLVDDPLGARGFYESLGFGATHDGMKLHL